MVGPIDQRKKKICRTNCRNLVIIEENHEEMVCSILLPLGFAQQITKAYSTL